MRGIRESWRLLCLVVLGCMVTTLVHGQSGASGSTVQKDGTPYLRASHAVDTLQGWYIPATGLYQTTGWWNAANAITALVDFSRIQKTKQFEPILEHTFTEAQKTGKNYLNDFYDDEGWWALAWIDAYDLTGKKQYLAMAETIFADMAASWDNTCGGGIWWSKERKYKNAIANELFLSVAAHLANRDKAQRAFYQEWANREWSWFSQSGMINSSNLINDGLTIGASTNGGPACTNNGQNTWSYNQGVVLGGLVELSKRNHDPALLQSASKIATAAIKGLSDSSGVMHDTCEPKCGADGVQFKGIFVRNLVVLQKAAPQNSYLTFVDTNADSIWNSARGPNFQLGQVWSGPFVEGDAASQTSALDALIAAASLHRK